MSAITAAITPGAAAVRLSASSSAANARRAPATFRSPSPSLGHVRPRPVAVTVAAGGKFGSKGGTGKAATAAVKQDPSATAITQPVQVPSRAHAGLVLPTLGKPRRSLFSTPFSRDKSLLLPQPRLPLS